MTNHMTLIKSLTINSADSSAKLEIAALSVDDVTYPWDYLNVTVTSAGLQATTRVYNFHYAQGVGGLAKLFADLAANWRG